MNRADAAHTMLYLRRRSLPAAYNVLLFLNEQLGAAASSHRRRRRRLGSLVLRRGEAGKRLRSRGLMRANGTGCGSRRLFWIGIRKAPTALHYSSLVGTGTTVKNGGRESIRRVRHQRTGVRGFGLRLQVEAVLWTGSWGGFYRAHLCAEHQLWLRNVAGLGQTFGPLAKGRVGRWRTAQQIRQRGGNLRGRTQTLPERRSSRTCLSQVSVW